MIGIAIALVYLAIGWQGAKFAMRRFERIYPSGHLESTDVAMGVVVGVLWPLFVPMVAFMTSADGKDDPESTDHKIRKVFGLPDRAKKWNER